MTDRQSPLEGRVIFVVGARRSGTHWLQRCLTAHPLIGAVPSESHLISHGIKPLLDRLHEGEPDDPTVGRVHAERKAAIAAARSFCDMVFEPYRAEGGWVSERTPVHVYHLGLIAELYPDAHLIHIIRDGRDVARSLVGQSWGPTTYSAAAMEWRDAIRAARDADLGPGRYREVRYEDLLAEPEPPISELLGWIGVPTGEQELRAVLGEAARIANTDSATPASGRWRSELRGHEIAEIEAVAAGELAAAGYQPTGTRDPWVGPRAALRRAAAVARRGGRR